MTFNPGIDVFDQPLRDAWWTPGWTAQNQSYIPVPPGPFQEQGFPPNLTYVTLTGNYFDADADFISGYLTFWPSSALTITESGGTTYLPQRFVGLNLTAMGTNKLGSGKVHLWNGQLSVNLLATDQPAVGVSMTPSTFTYHVKEHMYEGQEYDITVPSSFASTGVDIHSVIVAGSNVPDSDDTMQRIAAISTEYVSANLTMIAGNLPSNPTSYPVNFAFMTGVNEPGNTDWVAGSWVGSLAPYIGQILVGPANGGHVLPVGVYSVWVQIVTPQQVPVIQIGTLVIF
jgi:hypothetical protein